uniref:Uncharacterized protein n=1 Tax=Anguilla anguilla TaxID=7936 RepID=A0A0E9TZK2_ANGAN
MGSPSANPKRPRLPLLNFTPTHPTLGQLNYSAH